MSYTFIDHTADIGIRVCAPDPATLFAEAGRALAEMTGASCTQNEKAEGEMSLEVSVEGIDQADLLVRWLQELLFLIETREMCIASIRIAELDETRLKAGIRALRRTAPLSREIKAVTYHNLSIRHIHNSFEVTIIFDM